MRLSALRAVAALLSVSLVVAASCVVNQTTSSGATSSSSSGAGGAQTCTDHCNDGVLDCGEVGFDCGGTCGDCTTFDVATVCGPGAALPWSSPRLVSLQNPDGTDYVGDVEEPEVRDFGGARWLFFNDDPPGGNKDLYYARWDDAKQAFVVLGLLPGMGVQTLAVDGNPSLDQNGHLFFVSARTYPNPTESIHEGTLTVSGTPPTATLSGIKRLDGLSRPDVPWISQGVQVTWDGAWLYFDEAKFEGGPPTQSDVIAAKNVNGSYQRLSDADNAALLGNVNTAAFLEYAESSSRDGLELYFTRSWIDPKSFATALMCVMVSTRTDPNGPFGPPVNLAVTAPASGIVMEAPSLSPDEKTLYYHRRNKGDRARLYAVDRP